MSTLHNIRLYERHRQWLLELPCPSTDSYDDDLDSNLQRLGRQVSSAWSSFLQSAGRTLDSFARNSPHPQPDAWGTLGARDRLLTPRFHETSDRMTRVHAFVSGAGGDDGVSRLALSGLAKVRPDTKLIFVYVPMSTIYNGMDPTYSNVGELTSKVYKPKPPDTPPPVAENSAQTDIPPTARILDDEIIERNWEDFIPAHEEDDTKKTETGSQTVKTVMNGMVQTCNALFPQDKFLTQEQADGSEAAILPDNTEERGVGSDYAIPPITWEERSEGSREAILPDQACGSNTALQEPPQMKARGVGSENLFPVPPPSGTKVTSDAIHLSNVTTKADTTVLEKYDILYTREEMQSANYRLSDVNKGIHAAHQSVSYMLDKKGRPMDTLEENWSSDSETKLSELSSSTISGISQITYKAATHKTGKKSPAKTSTKTKKRNQAGSEAESDKSICVCDYGAANTKTKKRKQAGSEAESDKSICVCDYGAAPITKTKKRNQAGSEAESDKSICVCDSGGAGKRIGKKTESNRDWKDNSQISSENSLQVSRTPRVRIADGPHIKDPPCCEGREDWKNRSQSRSPGRDTCGLHIERRPSDGSPQRRQSLQGKSINHSRSPSREEVSSSASPGPSRRRRSVQADRSNSRSPTREKEPTKHSRRSRMAPRASQLPRSYSRERVRDSSKSSVSFPKRSSTVPRPAACPVHSQYAKSTDAIQTSVPKVLSPSPKRPASTPAGGGKKQRSPDASRTPSPSRRRLPVPPARASPCSLSSCSSHPGSRGRDRSNSRSPTRVSPWRATVSPPVTFSKDSQYERLYKADQADRSPLHSSLSLFSTAHENITQAKSPASATSASPLPQACVEYEEEEIFIRMEMDNSLTQPGLQTTDEKMDSPPQLASLSGCKPPSPMKRKSLFHDPHREETIDSGAVDNSLETDRELSDVINKTDDNRSDFIFKDTKDVYAKEEAVALDDGYRVTENQRREQEQSENSDTTDVAESDYGETKSNETVTAQTSRRCLPKGTGISALEAVFVASMTENFTEEEQVEQTPGISPRRSPLVSLISPGTQARSIPRVTPKKRTLSLSPSVQRRRSPCVLSLPRRPPSAGNIPSTEGESRARMKEMEVPEQIPGLSLSLAPPVTPRVTLNKAASQHELVSRPISSGVNGRPPTPEKRTKFMRSLSASPQPRRRTFQVDISYLKGLEEPHGVWPKHADRYLRDAYRAAVDSLRPPVFPAAESNLADSAHLTGLFEEEAETEFAPPGFADELLDESVGCQVRQGRSPYQEPNNLSFGNTGDVVSPVQRTPSTSPRSRTPTSPAPHTCSPSYSRASPMSPPLDRPLPSPTARSNISPYKSSPSYSIGSRKSRERSSSLGGSRVSPASFFQTPSYTAGSPTSPAFHGQSPMGSTGSPAHTAPCKQSPHYSTRSLSPASQMQPQRYNNGPETSPMSSKQSQSGITGSPTSPALYKQSPRISIEYPAHHSYGSPTPPKSNMFSQGIMSPTHQMLCIQSPNYNTELSPQLLTKQPSVCDTELWTLTEPGSPSLKPAARDTSRTPSSCPIHSPSSARSPERSKSPGKKPVSSGASHRSPSSPVRMSPTSSPPRQVSPGCVSKSVIPSKTSPSPGGRSSRSHRSRKPSTSPNMRTSHELSSPDRSSTSNRQPAPLSSPTVRTSRVCMSHTPSPTFMDRSSASFRDFLSPVDRSPVQLWETCQSPVSPTYRSPTFCAACAHSHSSLERTPAWCRPSSPSWLDFNRSPVAHASCEPLTSPDTRSAQRQEVSPATKSVTPECYSIDSFSSPPSRRSSPSSARKSAQRTPPTPASRGIWPPSSTTSPVGVSPPRLALSGSASPAYSNKSELHPATQMSLLDPAGDLSSPLQSLFNELSKTYGHFEQQKVCLSTSEESEECTAEVTTNDMKADTHQSSVQSPRSISTPRSAKSSPPYSIESTSLIPSPFCGVSISPSVSVSPRPSVRKAQSSGLSPVSPKEKATPRPQSSQSSNQNSIMSLSPTTCSPNHTVNRPSNRIAVLSISPALSSDFSLADQELEEALSSSSSSSELTTPQAVSYAMPEVTATSSPTVSPSCPVESSSPAINKAVSPIRSPNKIDESSQSQRSCYTFHRSSKSPSLLEEFEEILDVKHDSADTQQEHSLSPKRESVPSPNVCDSRRSPDLSRPPRQTNLSSPDRTKQTEHTNAPRPTSPRQVEGEEEEEEDGEDACQEEVYSIMITSPVASPNISTTLPVSKFNITTSTSPHITSDEMNMIANLAASIMDIVRVTSDLVSEAEGDDEEHTTRPTATSDSIKEEGFSSPQKQQTEGKIRSSPKPAEEGELTGAWSSSSEVKKSEHQADSVQSLSVRSEKGEPTHPSESGDVCPTATQQIVCASSPPAHLSSHVHSSGSHLGGSTEGSQFTQSEAERNTGPVTSPKRSPTFGTMKMGVCEGLSVIEEESTTDPHDEQTEDSDDSGQACASTEQTCPGQAEYSSAETCSLTGTSTGDEAGLAGQFSTQHGLLETKQMKIEVNLDIPATIPEAEGQDVPGAQTVSSQEFEIYDTSEHAERNQLVSGKECGNDLTTQDQSERMSQTTHLSSEESSTISIPLLSPPTTTAVLTLTSPQARLPEKHVKQSQTKPQMKLKSPLVGHMSFTHTSPQAQVAGQSFRTPASHAVSLPVSMQTELSTDMVLTQMSPQSGLASPSPPHAMLPGCAQQRSHTPLPSPGSDLSHSSGVPWATPSHSRSASPSPAQSHSRRSGRSHRSRRASPLTDASPLTKERTKSPLKSLAGRDLMASDISDIKVIREKQRKARKGRDSGESRPDKVTSSRSASSEKKIPFLQMLIKASEEASATEHEMKHEIKDSGKALSSRSKTPDKKITKDVDKKRQGLSLPLEHVTTSVVQKQVNIDGQPPSSRVTVTQKKVTYTAEPIQPSSAPSSRTAIKSPPRVMSWNPASETTLPQPVPIVPHKPVHSGRLVDGGGLVPQSDSESSERLYTGHGPAMLHSPQGRNMKKPPLPMIKPCAPSEMGVQEYRKGRVRTSPQRQVRMDKLAFTQPARMSSDPLPMQTAHAQSFPENTVWKRSVDSQLQVQPFLSPPTTRRMSGITTPEERAKILAAKMQNKKSPRRGGEGEALYHSRDHIEREAVKSHSSVGRESTLSAVKARLPTPQAYYPLVRQPSAEIHHPVIGRPGTRAKYSTAQRDFAVRHSAFNHASGEDEPVIKPGEISLHRAQDEYSSEYFSKYYRDGQKRGVSPTGSPKRSPKKRSPQHFLKKGKTIPPPLPIRQGPIDPYENLRRTFEKRRRNLTHSLLPSFNHNALAPPALARSDSEGRRPASFISPILDAYSTDPVVHPERHAETRPVGQERLPYRHCRMAIRDSRQNMPDSRLRPSDQPFEFHHRSPGSEMGVHKQIRRVSWNESELGQFWGRQRLLESRNQNAAMTTESSNNAKLASDSENYAISRLAGEPEITSSNTKRLVQQFESCARAQRATDVFADSQQQTYKQEVTVRKEDGSARFMLENAERNQLTCDEHYTFDAREQRSRKQFTFQNKLQCVSMTEEHTRSSEYIMKNPKLTPPTAHKTPVVVGLPLLAPYNKADQRDRSANNPNDTLSSDGSSCDDLHGPKPEETFLSLSEELKNAGWYPGPELAERDVAQTFWTLPDDEFEEWSDDEGDLPRGFSPWNRVRDSNSSANPPLQSEINKGMSAEKAALSWQAGFYTPREVADCSKDTPARAHLNDSVWKCHQAGVEKKLCNKPGRISISKPHCQSNSALYHSLENSENGLSFQNTTSLSKHQTKRQHPRGLDNINNSGDDKSMITPYKTVPSDTALVYPGAPEVAECNNHHVGAAAGDTSSANTRQHLWVAPTSSFPRTKPTIIRKRRSFGRSYLSNLLNRRCTEDSNVQVADTALQKMSCRTKSEVYGERRETSNINVDRVTNMCEACQLSKQPVGDSRHSDTRGMRTQKTSGQAAGLVFYKARRQGQCRPAVVDHHVSSCLQDNCAVPCTCTEHRCHGTIDGVDKPDASDIKEGNEEERRDCQGVTVPSCEQEWNLSLQSGQGSVPSAYSDDIHCPPCNTYKPGRGDGDVDRSHSKKRQVRKKKTCRLDKDIPREQKASNCCCVESDACQHADAAVVQDVFPSAGQAQGNASVAAFPASPTSADGSSQACKHSTFTVTECMVQAYGYNPLTVSPFTARGYPRLELDEPSLDYIMVPFVKRKALVFLKSDKHEFVEVGRGTYGCVYLAQATTTRGTAKVVVKDFFTDSTSWELIVHEARMLTYLQDTGVIPHFYGLLKRRSLGDDYSLIMQFFGQGTTLHTVLVNKEDLPPLIWQDVAWQLARGLLLIHEHHVLLNDLKGDNVLIDMRRERKIIKYIDLGMATYRKGLNFQLPEDQMSKFNFLAPEVRAGAFTSPMSDVYSLGYLLDQINRLAKLHVLKHTSKLCVQEIPANRPNLPHVVDLLQMRSDYVVDGVVARSDHPHDVRPAVASSM